MERPDDVPERYEYGMFTTYSAKASILGLDGKVTEEAQNVYVFTTGENQTIDRFDNFYELRNAFGAAGWMVESSGSGNLDKPPQWLQQAFADFYQKSGVVDTKMLIGMTGYHFQVRRRHVS